MSMSADERVSRSCRTVMCSKIHETPRVEELFLFEGWMMSMEKQNARITARRYSVGCPIHCGLGTVGHFAQSGCTQFEHEVRAHSNAAKVGIYGHSCGPVIVYGARQGCGRRSCCHVGQSRLLCRGDGYQYDRKCFRCEQPGRLFNVCAICFNSKQRRAKFQDRWIGYLQRLRTRKSGRSMISR